MIINANRMNAIGLLIKSIGLFTFIIEVRSLPSIISPKTIPKMIGTIGKSNRFKINPKIPKPAATAQSVKLLRRLYTPTKLKIRILIPKNRLGISITFNKEFVENNKNIKTRTFNIKSEIYRAITKSR